MRRELRFEVHYRFAGHPRQMTQTQIKFIVILFWTAIAAWWLVSSPGPVQAIALPAGHAATGAPLYWFKGNTHAHAAMELNGWTHGDSEPAKVLRWYREHGYHFAAISDHNLWRAGSPGSTGADSLLVLSAMEITSDHRYPGVIQEGERKIHSTALGTRQAVDWTFEDPSVSSIIQAHAVRTHEAGGLVILNHPNFRFQVQPQDIISANDIGLMEVFNAHPRANHEGHAGYRRGVESAWDQVLSAGRQVWGVAADDAHHFGWYGRWMQRFGSAPPGGAWIMVRASMLDEDHILEALSKGNFYASTGVILEDVTMRGGELSVSVDMALTESETRLPWVEAAAKSVPSDDGHLVIEFFGAHGKLMHWTHDHPEAVYRLPDGEPYVRARVTVLRKKFSVLGADEARAFYAWTQPMFTGRNSTQ